MGNTCCLGREKPPAPPAALAESEAVVLLRRRAQQPLGAKEEACGSSHGKTGQHDRPVDSVEAPNKEKEMTQEAMDNARRAQQPLGAKEEACGSSHGKTGQHDRPVDSVEAPNKEKEMTQEAMDNAFDTKARFFVRGLQTKGQQGGDEREWAACGDAGSLKPEMIACQKGAKASSNGPNQDNFCVTVFKNGYTFACVLDGHGKKGHVAATRAAQVIPFLLLEQGIGDEHVAEATIEKALIQAFEKADADLSGHLESGCTAVAALWKDYDVWTANAGDSRCILLEDNKVVFATSDHKPSCAEEKARVEGSGGEVRVEEQVPRVYAAGQRGPGLGVTRALGDAAAKSCGIIATPQVQHLRLDKHKEAKVVLASDGIWEVVGQKDLPSLVQDADTAKLQTAAFEGWAALTGGGYRDDVTSMVFPLRC